jgi:hypothetical protein
MTEKYTEYMDFEVIKKSMSEMDREWRKAGCPDPLNDMDEISEEMLRFFNALMSADDTSELSEFSDQILEDAESLLLDFGKVTGYIENIASDNTILGKQDTLVGNMKKRSLPSEGRRLL